MNCKEQLGDGNVKNDRERTEKLERKLEERRHRARTKVTYCAPEIRFIIDGVEAASQQLGNLRRVLYVQAGGDYFANEVEVCVLDFGESFWIVPDTAPFESCPDWMERLHALGGVHQARLDALPRAWMGGGWLGLGRHPVARVIVGEQLPTDDPTWHYDGPLNPEIGDVCRLGRGSRSGDGEDDCGRLGRVRAEAG